MENVFGFNFITAWIVVVVFYFLVQLWFIARMPILPAHPSIYDQVIFLIRSCDRMAVPAFLWHAQVMSLCLIFINAPLGLIATSMVQFAIAHTRWTYRKGTRVPFDVIAKMREKSCSKSKHYLNDLLDNKGGVCVQDLMTWLRLEHASTMAIKQ